MSRLAIIALEDGREFPALDGETLSWSIGLYMTPNEGRIGFPKAKAVIEAMAQQRPRDLALERREALRGGFDRMFGHNARTLLHLIDDTLEEIQSRKAPRVRS